MDKLERIAELGLYPTKDTLPFWEALLDGELLICRCAACGRFRMPPSGYCPGCQSSEVDWFRSSGTGTIYSWTIAQHGFTPSLNDKVPYVIALIELDDAPGVRLIANILDADANALAIGDAVAHDARHRDDARVDFVLAAGS